MKAAVILLLGVLLVAGCVSQAPQTQDNQQNSQPAANNTQTSQELYNPPAGNAISLDILSPLEGAIINSSAVGIHVNVTNFQLVDIIANRPDMPNQGHIHYFLDDKEQMSKFTSVSYSNIPAGTHVIRVELVNNDHTSLVPPVFRQITITTTG